MLSCNKMYLFHIEGAVKSKEVVFVHLGLVKGV